MEPRSKGKGNRLRALSPIREVSNVPVKVVRQGTKVMKGGAGHSPIMVQSLPGQVKVPKPSMKPMDRHYTAVDQVVSDYLHYAKYGQVAPVLYGSHGDSSLSCPCCRDRNQENTQRRLAIQRGDDPKDVSHLPPPRDVPDIPPIQLSARSELQTTTPRQKQLTVRFEEPGGRTPPRAVPPPQHAQESWVHYQPTPYAGTFLNPEFNRPFERQRAAEERRWPAENHLYDRILEADSKFDSSMNKLQSHYKNSFSQPQNSIVLDRDEVDYQY